MYFEKMYIWCSVCTLKKCVFDTIGRNLLYMSVRPIWSVVLFKSTVSLLIFFLDNLSTVERGILKYLAISSFNSVNICFKYLCTRIANPVGIPG